MRDSIDRDDQPLREGHNNFPRDSRPIPPGTAGVPNRRSAPAGEPGEQHSQRAKRAKYAPAACIECKKRKLKCIRPDESEPACQRCLANSTTCVFPQDLTLVNPGKEDVGKPVSNLENEIGLLREEVAALTSAFKEVAGNHMLSHNRGRSASENSPTPTYAPMEISRVLDPKAPQFVGHTGSAFSLNIAKTSLARMGIPIDSRALTSAPESPRARSEFPECRDPPPAPPDAQSGRGTVDPLLSLPLEEIVRLLEVFHEEVDSVYPFVSSTAMAAATQDIINFVRGMTGTSGQQQPGITPGGVGLKDVWILKMALASAIVIEAHGKNELSQALLDSVEPELCRISHGHNVDLKKLQATTLMGIYHFHCDEELLAWRAIGMAARMSLEMGIHRKRSLLDNFKRPEDQDFAIRAFWCVYVLDKRWSFGTGLPFALNECDIDPELPEPGGNLEYLRCLIGYGRLGSKVWQALPPFGVPTNSIPKEKVQYLEYLIQVWVSSIPSNLQFRHPRLGLALPNQPRRLHHLRTLMHLRGNHMRTLIYRHHVLSTSSVAADMESAWLVVNIAKDSIDALVHLASTTDIYIRQQAVFNYFLLSALAIIFVAVCHAPGTFYEPCRATFSNAVDLVKNLSRESHASRRLWNSIRGLLHGVKVLALQNESVRNHDDPQPQRPSNIYDSNAREALTATDQGLQTTVPLGQGLPGGLAFSPGTGTSLPDMLNVGNDLMGLFEGFGQPRAGLQQPMNASGPFGFNVQDLQLVGWDTDEISRQLQALI